MGALPCLPCPSSLLYDRNHKVIGSVTVARDLSEIKKALDESGRRQSAAAA